MAFNKEFELFESANAKCLAVSCDSIFVQLSWTKQYMDPTVKNIPLISDYNKDIAKNYGVLLDKEGISLRATVIISPDGIFVSFGQVKMIFNPLCLRNRQKHL